MFLHIMLIRKEEIDTLVERRKSSTIFFLCLEYEYWWTRQSLLKDHSGKGKALLVAIYINYLTSLICVIASSVDIKGGADTCQ